MIDRELTPNSKWKHFKRGIYLVIGTARNSEDPNQEFVLYKHLDGESEFGLDQLWIRPKKMFLEQVPRDGKTFWRFEKIEE
ncbi:MAG: DUF1653 domain-containing protein [Patescibacteria group bacterium]|jgi:hypothetical protein